MNKKLIALLVIIAAIFLLAFASVAVAQDVEDPNENWCYAGGPWGDGRCDSLDPDVTNWYWTCGWWRAHIFRGVHADTDAPQMCYAPRRLIALEFRTSDPTGPVDEEEEEEPPTLDATFSGNIDWCQYNEEAGGVQGNLTKAGISISSYVGTLSNINDVVRVVITASEFTHEEWIAPGSAGSFVVFIPGDYPTISGATLAAYSGLGEQLGSAALNNATCGERAPIEPPTPPEGGPEGGGSSDV